MGKCSELANNSQRFLNYVLRQVVIADYILSKIAVVVANYNFC